MKKQREKKITYEFDLSSAERKKQNAQPVNKYPADLALNTKSEFIYPIHNCKCSAKKEKPQVNPTKHRKTKSSLNSWYRHKRQKTPSKVKAKEGDYSGRKESETPEYTLDLMEISTKKEEKKPKTKTQVKFTAATEQASIFNMQKIKEDIYDSPEQKQKQSNLDFLDELSDIKDELESESQDASQIMQNF